MLSIHPPITKLALTTPFFHYAACWKTVELMAVTMSKDGKVEHAFRVRFSIAFVNQEFTSA
jgi:hypothetical protein